MAPSPKVTIITVSYNAERTIAQTIESVIRQGYSQLEYILIDGASTDNTLDIAARYRDVIDLLISEPDFGIYHAMNKGVGLASGEIIGILNADDWLEDGAIETVAKTFAHNSSLSVVYGAMHKVEKNGSTIKTVRSRETMSDLIAAPFNHPATFVRRSVYKALGGFDERYSTAADYDLMIRIKKGGFSYCYIDTPLANFREGGVTSKSIGFPVRDLLTIQKKNGYPFVWRWYGIFVRGLRMGGGLLIKFFAR